MLTLIPLLRHLTIQVSKGRITRWGAGVIVGTACAVAVFAPDPNQQQRSLFQLHQFLHVPGSAFIMTILLLAYPEPVGASRGHRLRRLGALFTVTVALGAVVELLQALLAGSMDLWDIGRDAGGAAMAALFAASVAGSRAPAGWALRMLALAIGVGLLLPTLAALEDEAHARRQFPVLADFGAQSEMDRFTWSRLSTVSREPEGGADEGRHIVRLTLWPGQYPGFSLAFFPRDWRGWRELVLNCSNLSPTPVPLTVRIDDLAHTQEYTDRYNHTFSLYPGRNEVRIPLEDVESAPRGRRLDLGQIRTLIAFSANLTEPRELLLHEIRLRR